MEWLFLLPLVAVGLAGGWLSYRLRFAPLMRSLEKHLREEAAERQAQRLRCWCEDCDFKAHGGLRSKMCVCPDCGNKRCPKAMHHDHYCTSSNASGQLGSAYGADLCRQCVTPKVCTRNQRCLTASA